MKKIRVNQRIKDDNPLQEGITNGTISDSVMFRLARKVGFKDGLLLSG